MTFGQSGNAQILVGPKLGAQYGWIGLDRDEDKEFLRPVPDIGFSAGGVAIFRVRERFYLHTELLYTLRRHSIDGKKDEDLKSVSTNSFIEIPITFKMNFTSNIKNLKYQWFVGAGPNLSYWLGGSTKIASSELMEQDRSPTNFKARFEGIPPLDADLKSLYVEDANRVQLGVNAVVGLMFEPQEGKAFIVDFRFDYGHSFYAREDYAYLANLLDYSEPMRIRYHAIKVGLTYVFDTNVSERKKGKSNFKQNKR